MTGSNIRIKTWIQTALALALTAIGLYIVFPGLPLHPDPQSIPSASLATPAPEWSAAVGRARRLLRATVTKENLAGLSVAVGAGGRLVWAEGFGWSNLDYRRPVTPDTRFRIGTASPGLTAAAIGQLTRQGKLNLDSEVQAYVPQFPRKQWPLTLRHILAGKSGMTDDAERDDRPLLRQRCETASEALPQFAKAPLAYEPGTRQRPSAYAWILASAAVETAAGRSFQDYMREQVFLPLGMRNTGAESTTDENPERTGEPEEDPPIATFVQDVVLRPLGITGPRPAPEAAPAPVYLPGFGPWPVIRHKVHVMRPYNLSCYAGAMAFYSTPADLVRFRLAGNRGEADVETGAVLGQTVAALVTVPDTGIVVTVTANAPLTGPVSLAREVAKAFAPAPR